MRRSDACAPGAFPTSSPTAWRSASELLFGSAIGRRAAPLVTLAVVALLVGGCAGPAAPAGVSYPRDVPFEDHGTISRSDHQDGAPAVIVAAGAQARATLERLAAPRRPIPDDRVAIAAFQGQQRTGGYAIKVDRITRRTATTLEVRAAFASPPPDAIVIQVLTSPAHVVSVARADLTGVDRVVLVDASGSQKAEASVATR